MLYVIPNLFHCHNNNPFYKDSILKFAHQVGIDDRRGCSFILKICYVFSLRTPLSQAFVLLTSRLERIESNNNNENSG